MHFGMKDFRKWSATVSFWKFKIFLIFPFLLNNPVHLNFSWFLKSIFFSLNSQINEKKKEIAPTTDKTRHQMLMSIHEKLEKVEKIDKLVEQNELLFKQNEQLMEQTKNLISLLRSNQSEHNHHSPMQNESNDVVHVLGVSSDEEVGEDVSFSESPAKNCTTNPTTTITPQQSITNTQPLVQNEPKEGTIRKNLERDDSCGVQGAKKKQRKTIGSGGKERIDVFKLMINSNRTNETKDSFDGFGSWKPQCLIEQLIRNRVDPTDPYNKNSINMKDWKHRSHKFKKIINLISDMIETKEDWALWTGKGGNVYPWQRDDGAKAKKMREMAKRVEDKLFKWVNSDEGRNTSNMPKIIPTKMDNLFKVNTLLSRLEGLKDQQRKKYYKDGRGTIIRKVRT